MSSVWNQGGSSFAKNAQRTRPDGPVSASRRAISRTADTPLALSSAPGEPGTVS